MNKASTSRDRTPAERLGSFASTHPETDAPVTFRLRTNVTSRRGSVEETIAAAVKPGGRIGDATFGEVTPEIVAGWPAEIVAKLFSRITGEAMEASPDRRRDEDLFDYYARARRHATSELGRFRALNVVRPRVMQRTSGTPRPRSTRRRASTSRRGPPAGDSDREPEPPRRRRVADALRRLIGRLR